MPCPPGVILSYLPLLRSVRSLASSARHNLSNPKYPVISRSFFLHGVTADVSDFFHCQPAQTPAVLSARASPRSESNADQLDGMEGEEGPEGPEGRKGRPQRPRRGSAMLRLTAGRRPRGRRRRPRSLQEQRSERRETPKCTAHERPSVCVRACVHTAVHCTANRFIVSLRVHVFLEAPGFLR